MEMQRRSKNCGSTAFGEVAAPPQPVASLATSGRSSWQMGPTPSGLGNHRDEGDALLQAFVLRLQVGPLVILVGSSRSASM